LTRGGRNFVVFKWDGTTELTVVGRVTKDNLDTVSFGSKNIGKNGTFGSVVTTCSRTLELDFGFEPNLVNFTQLTASWREMEGSLQAHFFDIFLTQN